MSKVKATAHRAPFGHGTGLAIMGCPPLRASGCAYRPGPMPVCLMIPYAHHILVEPGGNLPPVLNLCSCASQKGDPPRQTGGAIAVRSTRRAVSRAEALSPG